MTSKKVMQTRGRKKFLAAAIPLILAAQAQGVEFNFGEVEMSLDTQLTLGSSWRMEDRSDSLMLGIVSPDTNAQNNNDGDANFDKGDAFSQVFKGTHDFQISYENFGAFVRGKYWYDTLLEDGKTDDINNASFSAGTADGSAFSDDNASEYAKFSGAQILDAFVYGEFELGDMPLDLRIGKQVLSWGESTFIQGGINQTNPFDVAALRRPGAELKEGLIPVNMAFGSIGLTENLSAEAFYQLEHQETVISHCGTFFATNDYAPEGCGPVETAAGTISRDGGFEKGIKRPDEDGQFGVAFRYFSEALDTEFGVFALNVHSRVPLVSGRKATADYKAIYSDLGALDNSMIGLMQASADAQMAAAIAAGLAPEGTPAPVQTQANLDGLRAAAQADAIAAATAAATNDASFVSDGSLATLSSLSVGVMAGITTDASQTSPLASLIDPMTYFIEYPEDQQIAGLSFATNVAGVAVSGELTHKLDVPFQINATQLLTVGLQTEAIYEFTRDFYVNDLGQTADDAAIAARKAVSDRLGSYGLEALDLGDGESLGGFKTFDVTQAQVTAIKLFDQVLGANRYALVAEAGYTYVHDFDEDGDIKFDGNGAGLDTVTEGSWGYRLRVSGDYSDVFAGVNLSPVFSFSHDVEGVAPAPGGNFVEDQQVIGLALNAEYANMYTASVSYTMYEGGLTNSLVDRDNAAITLGVQF